MITALLVKFWEWWNRLSDGEQAILGLAGICFAGVAYLLVLEHTLGFERVLRWWWVVVLYLSADYLYYVKQGRYFLRRHRQGFELLQK